MEGYLQNWLDELRRPEVLIGLLLFTAGALVLWHAWQQEEHSAPWPLGAVMPF